jgi:hypothetical protein
VKSAPFKWCTTTFTTGLLIGMRLPHDIVKGMHLWVIFAKLLLYCMDSIHEGSNSTRSSQYGSLGMRCMIVSFCQDSGSVCLLTPGLLLGSPWLEFRCCALDSHLQPW